MMERTVAERILTPPMVRLLTLLSEVRGIDVEYSKVELASSAGISYASLYRIWPTVEKFELVIPSRRVGAVELFKVNRKSEILKRFSALAVQLGYEEAKKEQEHMPAERVGKPALAKA
jgi:hypothetical protein